MNIQISWPTSEEWKGFGRHVITYSAGAATAVAGVVAYGAALHLITPSEASGLSSGFASVADGVKAIVSGVTTLAGGLSTIAGVVMAIWAGYSSSPKKAAQIAASQPGTTVVTTPAIAAATPEKNIVSNTEHAVVQKGA